jgi:hypothetical protein
VQSSFLQKKVAHKMLMKLTPVILLGKVDVKKFSLFTSPLDFVASDFSRRRIVHSPTEKKNHFKCLNQWFLTFFAPWIPKSQNSYHACTPK